jgi:hypothetical protein
MHRFPYIARWHGGDQGMAVTACLQRSLHDPRTNAQFLKQQRGEPCRQRQGDAEHDAVRRRQDCEADSRRVQLEEACVRVRVHWCVQWRVLELATTGAWRDTFSHVDLTSCPPPHHLRNLPFPFAPSEMCMYVKVARYQALNWYLNTGHLQAIRTTMEYGASLGHPHNHRIPQLLHA